MLVPSECTLPSLHPAPCHWETGWPVPTRWQQWAPGTSRTQPPASGWAQPEEATWRSKSRVAALLSGYSRETESLHQSPPPGNPLDVALTAGSANGSHPWLRNGKGSQVLFTLLKLSSNYTVGICLLFLP